MSLAPVESPSTTDTGGFEEDMTHIICTCSPDVAFCSTEVIGDIEEDGEAVECLVCLDLAKWPCVRCGL